MSSLTAAQTASVVAAMERGRQIPGALLPILHDIQDQMGYVPADAIPLLAKGLNLSRAEVHGVVSFYHHFRTSPPGKHVIQICRAESCQAVGANELVAHAKASLGIDLHQTTSDGRFTLEPVYCLGNCACSPAMMVDDDLHGRVNADRFDSLIDHLVEAQ